MLLERRHATAYGPSEQGVRQYLASGNCEGQVDLDTIRSAPNKAQVPIAFGAD